MVNKNNIKQEIIADIDSAKCTINIAVSWITDIDLIDALMRAQNRGISIEIILSASKENIRVYSKMLQIIDNGGLIKKWGSVDALEGAFMHYKFYIIDKSVAKSGSYNWTFNASTNKETLDPVEAEKKLVQFDDLKADAVDYLTPIVINENQRVKEIRIEDIEKFNSLRSIAQTKAASIFYAIKDNKKVYEQFMESFNTKAYFQSLIQPGNKVANIDDIGKVKTSNNVNNNFSLKDYLFEHEGGILISDQAYKLLIEEHKKNYDIEQISFIQKNETYCYYKIKFIDNISKFKYLDIDYSLSEFYLRKQPPVFLRFTSKENWEYYADQNFKFKKGRPLDEFPYPAKIEIYKQPNSIPILGYLSHEILISDAAISKIEANNLTGFEFVWALSQYSNSPGRNNL